MNLTLLISILILLVLVLLLYNGDFLSPPAIVIFIFAICSYLSLYTTKRLQLDLHPDTYSVIMTGLISLTCGSLLIHLLYRVRRKKVYGYLKKEFRLIRIKNRSLLILLSSAIFIISTFSIFNVARSLAGGGMSAIIYAYRLNMLAGDERIPGIVSNLITYNYAIGYVMIYVIINNWFAERKIDRLLLLTVIFPSLTGLISGARGYLFHYLLFGVTVFYYFYMTKKGKKHVDLNLVTKIVMIGAVGIFGIYMLKFALGRQDTLGIFDYITGLLSAPIKLLDLYVTEHHNLSSTWGLETFTNMISTISRWSGNGIVRYNQYANFRYLNGISLGNVYTAFRAYYADFGMTGVIIVSGTIGAVSTIFYERFRCLYHDANSSINRNLFLYAYFSYGLSMMFYSNTLLEYIVNISFLKILLFWLFAKYVFIDGRLRRRRVSYRKTERLINHITK